ncbi:MAG: YraN family protein [Gammaproteobacteria bacterium]|jgi:putative endonuclease|nr:YraN family protein [Gammaproteobacteria bacterium]
MNSTSGLKRFLPGSIGAEFEKSAESYLNGQGLRTITRNYRCRLGEIDLIMDDGDFVIFVEVRYRYNHSYGNPLETITSAKQKRIIGATTRFLSCNPELQNRPCRFDAVGISDNDGHPEYDWVKDAFST